MTFSSSLRPGWSSFAHLFGGVFYRAMGELEATGKSRFEELYGSDFWSWLEANPDERATFDRAMEQGNVSRVERLDAVDWRDGAFQPGDLISSLATMGYAAHPFEPQRAETEEALQAQRLMKCLAVAGFAAMNIMLLSVSVWSGNVSDMAQETRDFFHWLSALIALPAAAYAGRPFFESAWRALRAWRTNTRTHAFAARCA